MMDMTKRNMEMYIMDRKIDEPHVTTYQSTLRNIPEERRPLDEFCL
jgi:hypothetical protein